MNRYSIALKKHEKIDTESFPPSSASLTLNGSIIIELQVISGHIDGQASRIYARTKNGYEQLSLIQSFDLHLTVNGISKSYATVISPEILQTSRYSTQAIKTIHKLKEIGSMMDLMNFSDIQNPHHSANV